MIDRAIIVPVKTASLPWRMARSMARKKVLSPISV
jgi:hypothetical protein